MTKNGFDVSYCQGHINWPALAKDPKAPYFIIPRVGFSTTRDREFENNVRGARENGIKIPGIYNFSYALNVKEAEEEAEFAVNSAKKAGLPNETIVFFDFEYDSEDWCKEKGVNPTPKFVQEVTQAFCDRVKQSGFKPGIYVNPDYYERMYKKKLPEGAVVWGARWGNKPPYFPYTFWQTGASEGFAGIGKVDTDVWMLEEPVKKTNDELANEVIRGDWGNGVERKQRLTDAGYDYDAVQDIVNEKLYGE